MTTQIIMTTHLSIEVYILKGIFTPCQCEIFCVLKQFTDTLFLWESNPLHCIYVTCCTTIF